MSTPVSAVDSSWAPYCFSEESSAEAGHLRAKDARSERNPSLLSAGAGRWFCRCGRVLATPRNIVLMTFFLGLMLLAIGCSDKGQVAGKACPLMIPDECLEVGTVWSDSAVPLTLPVTNTSDDEIRVNGTHASCSCAVIDRALSHYCRAQASTSRYHLLRHVPTAVLSRRRLSASIVVSMDTPARHCVWTIRGKVREAFELHPPALQFADVLVGTGAGTRSEVLIRWHASLLDVSIRSDVTSLSITPVRTDGQARRRMVVSLARDLPIGQYEGAIVCSASTPQGETVCARLPVRLGVIGDLHMMPTSRHLGVAFPGEQLTAIFQLLSRTGRKFTVRAWSIKPSDGVIVKYDRDSSIFTLSATPRGDGLATFALTIEVVDSSGGCQAITEAFQYESVGAIEVGD